MTNEQQLANQRQQRARPAQSALDIGNPSSKLSDDAMIPVYSELSVA